MAEQAVDTIYLLSEHPDEICGNLIQTMTKQLFSTEKVKPTQEEDTEMKDSIQGPAEPAETPDEHQITGSESRGYPLLTKNSFALSKLFFLVGHVAIKQIVHLENIDSEWKRRKQNGGRFFENNSFLIVKLQIVF